MPGSCSVNSRLHTRRTARKKVADDRSETDRSDRRLRWRLSSFSWLFCCCTSPAKTEDSVVAVEQTCDPNENAGAKCKTDSTEPHCNNAVKESKRKTKGKKKQLTAEVIKDSNEQKPSVKQRLLNLLCCTSAKVSPDELTEEKAQQQPPPEGSIADKTKTGKRTSSADQADTRAQMKISKQHSGTASTTSSECDRTKPAIMTGSSSSEALKTQSMQDLRAHHHDDSHHLMIRASKSDTFKPKKSETKHECSKASLASPVPSYGEAIASIAASDAEQNTVTSDGRLSRSLNDVRNAQTSSPSFLSQTRSAESIPLPPYRRFKDMEYEVHPSQASLNLLDDTESDEPLYC